MRDFFLAAILAAVNTSAGVGIVLWAFGLLP